MEEKKQVQPEEEQQEPSRQPDRSQLNAVENFYENFRGVKLRYLDIFIGCCVAALLLVVLFGALKGNGIL